MNLSAKRVLLFAVFIFTNLLCLTIGFVGGGVAEDLRLYHSRFEEESKILRERVLSDKRFMSLELHEESTGFATLWGVVASMEDRNELEKRLVQSFGDSLLDARMNGITTAMSPSE